MERLVTPPRRGTSPTWGLPPPCEQALKGKWYVRRFDPDTVQNSHIYSTMKEEKVVISSFSLGYAEDFSYGREEP